MVIHKYRFFAILSLLFCAAIFSIWMARTQVAEYAAITSMHQAGLENATTSIESIELNQSRITSLSFTLLTETGELLLIAQDISVDYHPNALAKGHLENISIKNLQLDYQQTDPEPSESKSTDANHTLEPVRAIAMLRRALRDYLLIDSLSIDKITLNGETFSTLQKKHFRLNSTIKDQTLFTELFLLDETIIKSSLYVTLNSASLTTELRLKKQDEQLATKLNLKIDDDRITGDYSIKPILLQHWLQPFLQSSKAIDGINGLSKIHGNLSIHFNQAGAIRATLSALSDKAIYKSYRADDIALKLKLTTTDKTPLRAVKLEKGSSLSVGVFSDQSFLLSNNKIDMSGNLKKLQDSWQFDGILKSKRLDITQDSQSFAIKDLNAQLMLKQERVDIDGVFSPDGVPARFAYSVRHNIKDASGRLHIRPENPLDLTSDTDKLSQILTPWPYPFDLFTGLIYLKSDASWSHDKPFALTTNIKFDNVGGNNNDLLFSGLSFEHSLDILPVLQSVETSKIKLAHIDSGVSIDNIETNLTISSSATEPQPKIILHDLYGEIFKGDFSSEELIYDLNLDRNTFKINADNIDLAEIVKTQQMNDIEVTGRISGQIPVELSQDGLFIKDGAFINDVSNGTIRYDPAAGTEQLKQNPLTGIALDALKDFRYSHLSAGVNFTPEGRLTINLQLKGVSPELDTDRPVHLNINTEQNLLSLLKSLRYAQGISEKLDNRVRQQFEQTR